MAPSDRRRNRVSSTRPKKRVPAQVPKTNTGVSSRISQKTRGMKAPAMASAVSVTIGVIELESAIVPRWIWAGAGPDMM